MDNGMEYQNVRTYHAGLLQDAEKRRLARQTAKESQRHEATRRNGLIRFGGYLHALGAYLQKRNRFAVQVPASTGRHSD
jgi:hypothetical protein